MARFSCVSGAERAKSQEENRHADCSNENSDDKRRYDYSREFLFHGQTVTMKGNLRNGTVGAARYRLLARFRAAIFDFDETIIDLEEQHTIASIELCREMGSDYFQMSESFRHGSGKRVIDDVRDLRQHFGWQEPVDQLLVLRQKHFDQACIDSDLKLLRGAERLIRDLHAQGKMLAVTSSAVRASIEAILERFDLLRLFTLIVDGSEVTQPKPDPEPYVLTAQKLGLPATGCVVFEDSTVGVQSAKAAGLFCVGVRNPNAKMKQDLSPADIVVESFESLKP